MALLKNNRRQAVLANPFKIESMTSRLCFYQILVLAPKSFCCPVRGSSHWKTKKAVICTSSR